MYFPLALGCRPWLLLLLAGLYGASRAFAAPTDETVVMSPFEVSANSVEFKNWIRLKSAHFIFYTDATSKEAIHELQAAEDLLETSQLYFGRVARESAPSIVVLPTTRSEWLKIQSKGRVEWKVATSGSENELVDLKTIQYDWLADSTVLHSSFGATIADRLDLAEPFWFARGIRRLVESAEIEPDHAVFGRHNNRIYALTVQGWLPWDVFFGVTDNSPEYTKSKYINRFEGQCSMFMQYLFTRDDPKMKDRLMLWVAWLQAGNPATEAKFKEVFGQDWKEWQLTMRRYADGGQYRATTFKLNHTPLDSPVLEKFDPPTKEMRELFVLSQIITQDVPESDQALKSILAHGLQTESLRELFIEACLARKEKAVALSELRQRIAAGSTNQAVYSRAAYLRFKTILPTISADARLSAEDATELRGWLLRTLQVDPLEPTANSLLVWVEALSPTVEAENLTTIERIYHTIEGRVSTSDAVAALAVAHWRIGHLPAARKLAHTLLDSPYTDEDGRRTASGLLAKIPENAP